MAVYSKLLLSTGGGIVSTQQQADQEPNTATILVGLGGTGVDCLRTIKTQVYDRLKPDDEEAVEPGYQRIRFIGVDTTAKSAGDSTGLDGDAAKGDGNMALKGNEFFFIGNADIARVLDNRLALGMRDDLAWLDHEHIRLPDLADAGAGGIRQVGRLMMMDRSTEFKNRLMSEISTAREGLPAPRVNVHVFAGLSGGTGSGAFLDVCYLIRSLANELNITITTYGYFFLPDVNLQNVPMEMRAVREYIPKNGYAAMQELDYCMNLQENGGAFQQKYQTGSMVAWDGPPVNMCHLVCATDRNMNVHPDGYNYAMNVTAEYIMDFLTKSEGFGLDQHLSNFSSMVAQTNTEKSIGSGMHYCAIGASCASIPLREINTYLASALFGKFATIATNMPTQRDVEVFATTALLNNPKAPVSDLYNGLYRELSNQMNTSFNPYPDDYKTVKDYGNEQMVRWYTNQKAEKFNRIEANTRSMTSQDNAASLLGRTRSQLEVVLKDLVRGPIFGHRMLAAAQTHNLLNVIDGLIAENKSKWGQEADQSALRQSTYENAKSDFDNCSDGMFSGGRLRRYFDSYVFALEQVVTHQVHMELFKQMDAVLRTYRAQIVEVTGSYYIKLSRVVETLMETFKANRDALASQNATSHVNAFATPMMTVADLKGALDKEIGHMNISGMLDAFMNTLIQNQDIWIGEDERKITRMVTDFFVKTAFAGFANRSITTYLKDMYHAVHGDITNAQLTQLVYKDWIVKLTQKASPLFGFNASVWQEASTSKLAFVSIPSVSAPIKAAAQQMQAASAQWKPKDSALTDRIFVMCSACGFPMSAYANCKLYEDNFFSALAPGRHYYAGRPLAGARFTDWNKLPSITPQSLIPADGIASIDQRNMLLDARALYHKAVELNMIDDHDHICQPDPEAVAALGSLCDKCDAVLAAMASPADIPNAQSAMGALQGNLIIPMVATQYYMPQDGVRTDVRTIKNVQQDHFVYAPVYQCLVQDAMEGYGAAQQRAKDLIQALEEKIERMGAEGKDWNDYTNALFTGIISLAGMNMAYEFSEWGIKTTHQLSKFGEEFPFATIVVYQGFLSFKALPSEVKAQIREKIGEVFNTAADLSEIGAKLKKDLSDERTMAWVQQAQVMKEKDEIMAFLRKLKSTFATFCMAHGI